jgi:iron complex outermembrane recepter protein
MVERERTQLVTEASDIAQLQSHVNSRIGDTFQRFGDQQNKGIQTMSEKSQLAIRLDLVIGVILAAIMALWALPSRAADDTGQPQTSVAQQAVGPTPSSKPSSKDKNDAADSSSLSEIVVTGSLIADPSLAKSSPVLSVSEEEIELRQNNVAEELLRTIPGAVAGTNAEVINSTYGASTVNLRGLGENRNIVLLDGARMTPWGLDGSVDLNDIPLALIDHVEVLTGGAVSTYGADAIAGVVNFVTKRNFSGLQIDASDQINQKGDGNTLRTDLLLGGDIDDHRGNAFLSFGFQDSHGLFRNERPNTLPTIDSYTGLQTDASGSTLPASFSVPGQGLLEINPATGALVPQSLAYDGGKYGTLSTPFQRYNIFGSVNYKVAGDIDAYGETMFSKYFVSAPYSPTDPVGALFQIPYSNPFLPAPARNQFCAANGLTPAQCAAAAAATNPNSSSYQTFSTEIFRPFVELGNTGLDWNTTLYQMRFGFRGPITDRLSFDVYATYGEGENTQILTANGLYSNMQQALLATSTTSCLNPSNGCVPIDVFGPVGSLSKAAAEFVTGGPTYITTRTQLGVAHGVINGDLGLASPLAATDVKYAVGAEYRKYAVNTLPDQISAEPGQLLDDGAVPQFYGAYDVKEGFVETIAPLLEDRPFAKNLTLELGGRESDYSTAGRNFTWKAGGSWEPTEGVKFRGNYQVAARAPNIGELFTPLSRGYASISVDPCAGPDVTPDSALGRVCIAQGAPASALGHIITPGEVNSVIGGNHDLGVETARTYTFGVVYLPEQVRPLSVALDYYHIAISHAISQADPGDVIDACFSSADNPGLNVTPACTAIRRNPTTGDLNGDQTTTPGLPLVFSNLGTLETDGVDLSINERLDLPFGRLALGFDGNWTHKSSFQSTPTSEPRECAGYYSVNCESIQPKLSWTQRTTLSVRDFDLSLQWQYIGAESYEPQAIIDNGGPAFSPLPQYEHIDAYSYFNLTARWKATNDIQLTFVVQNLFDKQPPIVGSTIGYYNYNYANTFPATYDVQGRRFGLNLNMHF